MNKPHLRVFILLFNIIVIFVLSGCNWSMSAQGSISESDIVEFYENNAASLNDSVQEYMLHTNGKSVNICFLDGLDRDVLTSIGNVGGVVVDDSELVIWEPETKTNYTVNIEDYKKCVNALFLMDDFMLEHSYIQKNDDYTVSVTGDKLGAEYSCDGETIPNLISFNFRDIVKNFDYRLIYSETELTEEYKKIDENWYVEYWYNV